MTNLKLPVLSTVADIVLKDTSGQEVKASSIWADKPTLIFCLRRPGCILCRDQAKRLWDHHEEFEKLGVQLVCVVHEWRQLEINAFVPAFWGGAIYHDADKSLYKVLGEGKVRKGGLLSMLNPFSAEWKRINDAKKRVSEHNMVGDGSVLGGLLIVKKGDGGVVHMSREETFGEYAPMDKVLGDAKLAVL